MFKNIISFFKKDDDSFSELENRILDDLADKLSEENASSLRDRIENVNLVQRIDNAKYVNCYHMVKGKPCFDARHRMTELDNEENLADFCVLLIDGRKIDGTIWLVKGVLFSIEYSSAAENIGLNDIEKVLVTPKPGFSREG